MALKRQDNLMATFSMASMTDVIFLLLIFFMVTSTFIFPTALEVNLPQSNQQTVLKPTTRIYIDAQGEYYSATGDAEEPLHLNRQELTSWLQLIKQHNAEEVIALYADETVPYGGIVEVLNAGTECGLKIVLATRSVENL